MTLLLLLVFWLLWFLNFSSRTMLFPLLPIFQRNLNISHALAGSVLSGCMTFSFFSVSSEAYEPAMAHFESGKSPLSVLEMGGEFHVI
jgi:hypothetical protein